MEDVKDIIESLLFISENPLTIEEMKQVLPLVDTRQILLSINALMEEYEQRGGGFYLKEIAEGYQLRTRPEFREYIKKLIQTPAPRLSRAALETLAIIAYKQPIIRADIEHIRGVDSGGVLRMLMEKNLIRVLGRKEIPGRPLIYATTKQFLEVFDLKNLKDLPSPKEIEELTQFSEEELPDGFIDPIDEMNAIRKEPVPDTEPKPPLEPDSPDSFPSTDPSEHTKDHEPLNDTD